MDRQAWRSLAISFVLFGGVGIVFLFGAQVLGFNGEATVERWLGSASGPWALPAAVGAFAGLAFLGVPQFVLIAAAVVAFGAWDGFAYSWIGTMVSAIVGFYLGRFAGARALQTLSGESMQRFMDMVGRNGFLASLIVRLVPSAPFIVVNMAAGVTPMRVSQFLAGTAIGIIPKIAVTAFAGSSIVKALKGEGGGPLVWLAVAALKELFGRCRRGRLAAVPGGQLLRRRIPAQQEGAAAEARGLRLDHCQHGLRRDRRIDRGAAGAQRSHAGLGRQRMRGGDHLALGQGRACREQQQQEKAKHRRGGAPEVGGI
jgi:uncharacterized membrane protein YdjX (TVP38/TMEM64 family)